MTQESERACSANTVLIRGAICRAANEEHLLHFSRLFKMLKDGAVDEGWLRAVEQKDNILPAVDYRIYRADYAPSRTGTADGARSVCHGTNS